jgi:hypothetical protein
VAVKDFVIEPIGNSVVVSTLDPLSMSLSPKACSSGGASCRTNASAKPGICHSAITSVTTVWRSGKHAVIDASCAVDRPAMEEFLALSSKMRPGPTRGHASVTWQQVNRSDGLAARHWLKGFVEIPQHRPGRLQRDAGRITCRKASVHQRCLLPHYEWPFRVISGGLRPSEYLAGHGPFDGARRPLRFSARVL